MARFRAEIRGQRGPATRLGSSGSGLVASANGWNLGGRVFLHVNGQGRDELAFFLNGGSNDRTAETLILTVEEGGPVRFYGCARAERSA